MPPRDCHYCPHTFFEATLEDAYLECLRRGGDSGRGGRGRGGRAVAYLRKKCVRVARDDDDAQTDGECRDEPASERAASAMRRADGWMMGTPSPQSPFGTCERGTRARQNDRFAVRNSEEEEEQQLSVFRT